MVFRIKVQKQFLFVYIAAIAIFGLSTFLTLSTQSAFAGCSGNCGGCHPSGGNCDEGDDGAEERCCWDDNCNSPGGCGGADDPSCGNCVWHCEPPECECTEVNCPNEPATKWRQMAVASNATYRDCDGSDDCNPSTGACGPVYRNTPPTCSIAPGGISMTRGDAPEEFTLTVTDGDYGDTVNLVGYEVQNTAGDITNCVSIRRTAGGGLMGPVKTGSNTPGDTTNTVTFLADPNNVHGVYDVVNGQSRCTGKLIFEIRDELGPGDTLDTQATRTCSVNVNILNNAPQLVDVKIYDLDNMASQRQSGDQLGNDGNPVYVGSVLESKRATYCSTTMAATDPVAMLTNIGVCPGANMVPVAGLSKKNPFEVDITIRDANGIKDILQAGIWIQRASVNGSQRDVPLAAANARNSIQALYAEHTNDNINNYFLPRGCFGSGCGPTEITTSGNTRLLAYSLIANRTAPGPGGLSGNISSSNFKSATYKSWLRSGYPDCLATGGGCGDNIPASVKGVTATTNTDTFNNYDWVVTHDDSQLLCYQSSGTANVTKVVTNQGVCPTSCAACARKLGMVPIDANTVTFKYQFYFNDSDGGGQFMNSGIYHVYLNALDKVGATLGNIAPVASDEEGWAKIDNLGRLCSGTACPAANPAFHLVFDPTAPDVTIQPRIATDTSIDVQVDIADPLLSDGSVGAKLAGDSAGFIVREAWVDGEPRARYWATRPASQGGGNYDGRSDDTRRASNVDPKLYASNPRTLTTHMFGESLVPAEHITVGLCAYDMVGNMKCGNNGLSSYVFIGPWLKTSLGDVFSNTNPSGNAFSMTIPNTADLTATNAAFAPYTYQSNTVATGVMISGGAFGVQGGKVISGTDYALGFSSSAAASPGFYRTVNAPTSVEPFNLSHLPLSASGNEYARLFAIASSNCDLLNIASENSCEVMNSGITASNVGSTASPYKIIKASGGEVTENLVCRGTNMIFITSGTVTIKGQVTKAANSGCIFVVSSGAKLEVIDVSSRARIYAGAVGAVGEVGAPTVDSFDAGVIAAQGGIISFPKGELGTINNAHPSTPMSSYDRLQIRGFIYSSDQLPILKRELASVDNKRYPSEWLIYDASLLDVFRPLLGTMPTVDVICGTSKHVLCE